MTPFLFVVGGVVAALLLLLLDVLVTWRAAQR